MLCSKCRATVAKGYTTDVTDIGNCLVIVRNVPCYKCSECTEVIYTADVVQRLEKIVDASRNLIQEVSIIDYASCVIDNQNNST